MDENQTPPTDQPVEDQAQIQESDTSNEDLSPEERVGTPDGEELSDLEGNPTNERVVYDYDDDGNFVGWHKESTNG